MLIYLYDIKTNLNEYNKIKRRFYYNLRKSNLKNCEYLTKSVLLVPEDLEHEADIFFNKFIRYLEVYKLKVSEILEF
ncbi:hypothetical protein KO317_00675 [Candidatus Micrarchaeota archaeon]|jgi:hypothetical protein|nr:hypothetical protein [Candidatus Micrarchaeota archaeon]